MEKTLEIHMQELRVHLAKEIELVIIEDSITNAIGMKREAIKIVLGN